MPQEYTVKDNQTGKTVTFRWNQTTPPTDADMEEVFSAARSTPAPTPQAAPAEGGGVLGTVKDLAVGAVKEVGDTVATLGSLVHKIPGVSTAVDALYGTPGVSQASFREAERVTAPTNTAQSIGKGVTQLAGAVIPGGMVGRATKAMSLPARMGAEAATSAGIATAQGADTGGAGVAGVIGSAVPVVGRALGSRTASALRESAEKRVAQALGATKERFKAIAEKRAPEIIARGLGGTRSQLLKDATDRAREAGSAIDDVLKGSGERPISTQSVIDALEEAKAGFSVTRELSIPEAMRSGQHRLAGARPTPNGRVSVPVVLDQRPIDQLTKLQDTIRALGDEATVEQLVATRRVWDDVVGRAGGYAHRAGGAFGVPLAEQTEAWAKREATKAIRQALAADVPDLSKVNKEYAFWKDLKDVLTATERRTQAQGPGLSRVVMATVGAGSGYASGETMGDRLRNAALAGIAGPRILAGLQSAKWKFVDARLRNALADAIESGSPGRVASAAARIMAVQSGRSASSTTDETAPPPAAPGQR